MDVLELASECKCENFVSNIIVQNILNNLWSHKNQTDNLKTQVKYFNMEIFIYNSYFEVGQRTFRKRIFRMSKEKQQQQRLHVS
jgi:hypothetical protein